MKKILIMGLPGSGKTYFAERLKEYIETHGEFHSLADSLNIPTKHSYPLRPMTSELLSRTLRSGLS
jgi:adenylate kinase family enzyme